MTSPIKKRTAPSVNLTIESTDESGAKSTRNFRLCFDFNVLARIEEKTNIKMLGFDIWSQLSAKTIGVMFWACAIPNHPEYDSDEGLEALCSYLDFESGEKVADALWEAFLLYLPKERADKFRDARKKREAGELPNAPAPAETVQETTSTGNDSSQSPVTISASASAS